MKAKYTFIMLAVMMFFIGTPAYAEVPHAGWAYGVITDGDNSPISAKVNATCTLSGAVSEEAYSNQFTGYYWLYIDCYEGDEVCVTAEDEFGNVNTVCDWMEDGDNQNGVEVDIALINVIVTPEFGLIAIPMMLSMAGFMFMRGKM